MPHICPLCLVSGQTTDVHGPDNRRYHLCHNCSLIFVNPCHRLSPEDEKTRYTTHNNSIENDGYVRFLHRLVHPMLPYLDATMRGLDYGCGPSPTLSKLLRRQGMMCDDYDPFFACRPLRPPYDYIFSTECFEHFHYPNKEMQRLCSLLQPGGLLGIMTEQWSTLEHFATWHYPRDRTHTSFYHEHTFAFLSRQFGWNMLYTEGNRVVILRRQHSSADHPHAAG
jgi:SAM-dependent methyltransferase